MDVNGAKLRIGFDVKEVEGELKTTMDSPDQGAYDLPSDETTYKDGVLKVRMEKMGISYVGKPQGESMDGVFEQNGMQLDLNMKKKTKVEKTSNSSTEIDQKSLEKVLGYWEGKLNINGTDLRIGFEIKAEDGLLKATMDSPDQGAYDLPCSSASFEEGKLQLEMQGLGVRYIGEPKGEEMTGTFEQNGMSLDLNMKRNRETTGGRTAKPQDPKEPFNYESKKVVFENESADLKLAGTLTIPKDCKDCQAAILISGSGPQDRDESLLGHKPFWVIADYLSERGIAVLRFDDRGVGESTGTFGGSTSADFMTDVAAAFAFLKQQKGIDPAKIGLIGHSEGGLIAPMLAAQNEEIAFIISLAGPGTMGKDLLPEQARLITKASGASEQEVKETYETTKRICNLVAKEKDLEKLKAKIRPLIEKEDIPEAQVDAALQEYSSNWFRFFMAYDPVADWKKVKCPVLALNGSKDLQVPADENLRGIEKALKNNKQVKIMKMEGLNHLFQKTETGNPSEYAELEETFSEEVLKIMKDWIVLSDK